MPSSIPVRHWCSFLADALLAQSSERIAKTASGWRFRLVRIRMLCAIETFVWRFIGGFADFIAGSGSCARFCARDPQTESRQLARPRLGGSAQVTILFLEALKSLVFLADVLHDLPRGV